MQSESALWTPGVKTAKQQSVSRVPLLSSAGSVLQDDTEAAQELGTLLWPRLAAKYVEKCLAPHPPADGAKGERDKGCQVIRVIKVSATRVITCSPAASVVATP